MQRTWAVCGFKAKTDKAGVIKDSKSISPCGRPEAISADVSKIFANKLHIDVIPASLLFRQQPVCLSFV